MKTNVILKSPDRNLFGIQIRQESKTQMLNLSDLQEAYTRARIQNGWSDRRIEDILSSKFNIERIYYLLKEQGFINTEISAFMRETENTGFLKYLKQLGAYKTTGARQTKTTWCNPYIWVLVAMELNPMLYARVVMWLGDKLCLNRIEAGNFCKELNRAVYSIKDVDFVKLAIALNRKIFGKHETGIRNTGTKEQLKKLTELETKIAFLIDMGYENTMNGVLKAIEKA